MTKSPKLSVIIPAYNTPVELFDACLKSVAEQKYDEPYEIIVIDDGSTQPNPYEAISKQYGATYHYKDNGGVSTSRNKGVELAKGEFVLFVDADDYLALDYLKKTMTIIEKRGVDILICGHMVIENGNKFPWNPTELKSGSRDDLVVDLILKNHYYTCAGSIFRRSIAAAHPSRTDMTMGEDTLFVFECCADARVAVATPSSYYYIKNSYSATKARLKRAVAAKTLANKNLESNIKLYKAILDAYPQHQEQIDTALTSKAYDALSLYLDSEDATKDGYIEYCREIATKINFSALYVPQTDYSQSKKKGMKLLASRRYGSSYRLNRLKNFVKRHR